jgi:hypothetical protein
VAAVIKAGAASLAFILVTPPLDNFSIADATEGTQS